MSMELIVLRLVHVLGGIFWVGGGIYSAVFVMPAIATAGPAAGPIMAELHRRRLFTVLPIVAVLTMLSGVRLCWIVSGGFPASYFETAPGFTYAAAAAASLIGFLTAMFISRPASQRLGALGASLAQLEGQARAAAVTEIERLKPRAAVGTAAAVWLLTLSAVGMSVARYL